VILQIVEATQKPTCPVSGLGEKATVVANKATGKFVSAHDLRRSFAPRRHA
jgi:hypothetical protein